MTDKSQVKAVMEYYNCSKIIAEKIVASMPESQIPGNYIWNNDWKRKEKAK